MKKIIVLFFLVLLIFDCKSQTAESYIQIGISKAERGDYKGAIADFNKAIEINSKYAYAYYLRGLAKITLKDKNGACIDLSKSGELGVSDAYDLIKKYCN